MKDIDLNKDTFDLILHFVRGYIIPVFGSIVIIILFIFAYIPLFYGIINNYNSDIQYKEEIQTDVNNLALYKSNSSTAAQNKLTSQLSNLNNTLPDYLDNGLLLNSIEQLAQKNDCVVQSVNLNLSAVTNISNILSNLNQNANVSEVDLKLNCTGSQLMSLLNDMETNQDINVLLSVNENGDMLSNQVDSVDLVYNYFSLSSNLLLKNFNI